MQSLDRGVVVCDAGGKLFVVWGAAGPLVSLMPIIKIGRIRRLGHIVRVGAVISGSDARIIAVDAEARSHMRCENILVVGRVLLSGMRLLERDMEEQQRELAAADARAAKARNERRVATAIYMARHRSMMAMACEIVATHWPKEDALHAVG